MGLRLGLGYHRAHTVNCSQLSEWLPVRTAAGHVRGEHRGAQLGARLRPQLLRHHPGTKIKIYFSHT